MDKRALIEKIVAQLGGELELLTKAARAAHTEATQRNFYFIAPRAGGTEVTLDEREILVLTPQSPLGQQLVGRKQGDKIKLSIAGTTSEFRVASVA